MKKLIALLALVLVSTSTMMYAQESERAVRRADRKAQRDAERARLKAEEQAADAVAYQQAVQALKNKQFVLEADQRSTVQVAFNTPYPGPNGIGGVTVDGSASDMKITTDKKGNVNCSFSVQGIGISAQIFISLTNGGNNATVTVNPNFNNNTLTLSGNIVPLDQSDVFKGRSW